LTQGISPPAVRQSKPALISKDSQALSVKYDSQRRTGRLYMPPGNCCDMQGCIRHFLGIDPDVRIIETFAGGVRDTCYERAADGWRVSYVP
jgi:hypothetical protein